MSDRILISRDLLTRICAQMAEFRGEAHGETDFGPYGAEAELLKILERHGNDRDTLWNKDSIDQHIAWMRGYLATMTADNWQDMRLRLQRQVDKIAPPARTAERERG